MSGFPGDVASTMSTGPAGADARAAHLNPTELIANSPMSWRQIIIVALCVALNALDGFDVLSISFASPGIAGEWHLERAALGVILSMELIGMTLGSLFLGRLADRMGRRPTALLCLIVMAAGMISAPTSSSVEMLGLIRLLTGIGIGGMLAATNAIVAETASRKRRDLCVALMAGGYPVGAIIGGALASLLLASGAGWRSVFAIGAAAALGLLPLVWLLMRETIAFLEERRPIDFQSRIDRVLLDFGHEPMILADRVGTASHTSWLNLFEGEQRRTTVLLTIAYLAHIMTFYYILKWIPKIVVDLGHAPTEAAGVLVWANVGGASGALALSLLSQRLPVRRLCIMAMLASVGMVAIFGWAGTTMVRLSIIAAVAGFCTNAGVVGLYALMARGFSSDLRGAGTGFVIGVGRGGSALAPMAAGFLFAMGAGLPSVSLTMAAGSLLAASALLALRTQSSCR